jgi:dolichol-phosphate mannosyltransferase
MTGSASTRRYRPCAAGAEEVILQAKPLASIILATYNERENILDMVASILEHVREPVEIIVVDDDSPDGTWKLVEELNDPRVRLVRRKRARGLASAINRGIIESRGEIVGWLDADMSMNPAYLPAMIERLATYDVVIGSRYVEGGADLRPRFRIVTSSLVNHFARIVLADSHIHDYDSGFIVMRRSVLDSVTLLPYGYGAYFIEFIYHCRRKGLEVYEHPYEFVDREKGTSKSAPGMLNFLLTGLEYGFRIIVTRLRRFD